MGNIYNVKSVVNISFSGKLLLAGVPNEIETKTESEKTALMQLFKDKKLVDISKELEAEAQAEAAAQAEAEAAAQAEAEAAAQAEAERLALENSESEVNQSEEEANETEETGNEPEETEEVVIDSLKELDQQLEQTTKPSGTSRKRGK